MTRFAFPELELTRRYFVAVVFVSILALTSIGFAAEKINISSHRQQVLTQPFLDAFAAKTGIGINVVYSSKGSEQRLKAEGLASPANVILTVDIERLSGYQINPPVSVNGELASWGRFKPDSLPMERLATLVPNEQMIIDRVGW